MLRLSRGQAKLITPMHGKSFFQFGASHAPVRFVEFVRPSQRFIWNASENSAGNKIGQTAWSFSISAGVLKHRFLQPPQVALCYDLSHAKLKILSQALLLCPF